MTDFIRPNGKPYRPRKPHLIPEIAELRARLAEAEKGLREADETVEDNGPEAHG